MKTPTNTCFVGHRGVARQMFQLLETYDSNLWMSEPPCVWIKERGDDVHPGPWSVDLRSLHVYRESDSCSSFFWTGFAPLGVRHVTYLAGSTNMWQGIGGAGCQRAQQQWHNRRCVSGRRNWNQKEGRHVDSMLSKRLGPECTTSRLIHSRPSVCAATSVIRTYHALKRNHFSRDPSFL